MMTVIWLVTIVYLALMMYIGFWTKKRAEKDMQSYSIAGKQLPFYLLFWTFIATMFGAGNFIGNADKMGAVGVSWLPFIWGEQGGKILFALTLAGFVARFSYNTMADFLDDLVVKNKHVKAISGILLSTLGIAWTGGQAMGIGALYSTFTGANPLFVTWVAAIVFIAYTTMGGLLAVVWTDLIQGILVAIFGIAFYLEAFRVVDFSFAKLGAAVTKIDPKLWSFSVSPMAIVSAFLAPAMAQFAYQVTWQRCFAAKRPEDARRSYLWTGIICVIAVTFTGFVGLIARTVLPATVKTGLAPALIKSAFISPAVTVGMFMLIVAATMSTADSFLNSAAVNLVNDVVATYRPDLTQAQLVSYTRIATVAVGVASMLGTLYFKFIMDYAALGYNLCGATLFPLLVIGLLWKRDPKAPASFRNCPITPTAALVALVAGSVVTVAFQLNVALKAILGGGIVPGAIVTSVLLVVVSLFTAAEPEDLEPAASRVKAQKAA